MKEYALDLVQMDHLLTRLVIPFAWKILGAFAIWFVGGFLVRVVQKILVKSLQSRRIDPTLVQYANSSLAWILKSLLILAILGIFGIETTSFSALLAAAGVAIGVAWSGLLSNFAAGVFLIVLRPFKVGETISAAGITGTVKEIGLFATTIDNGENLRVFVGNNKLFSDNILNYSANAYRNLNFRVQLSHEVIPNQALAKLTSSLQSIREVTEGQNVSGEILEFNPQGILVILKVPCHHRDSVSVTTQANQLIYQTLKAEKYPDPLPRSLVIQQNR